MRLLDNWRAVLRHAWSVRLLVLAAILTAAEVAYGVLATNPPAEHLVAFAVGGGVLSLASFAARFIAQKPLSGGGNEPD